MNQLRKSSRTASQSRTSSIQQFTKPARGALGVSGVAAVATNIAYVRFVVAIVWFLVHLLSGRRTLALEALTIFVTSIDGRFVFARTAALGAGGHREYERYQQLQHSTALFTTA